MHWRRDSMTHEEVNELGECPDCHGRGVLFTPSKNEFHKRKQCANCSGTGYVRRPAKGADDKTVPVSGEGR